MINKKEHELLKIMTENPDLQVMYFMNNETIDDNYTSTIVEIENIKIELLAQNDDGVWIDYDEFIEDKAYDENITHEQAEKFYPAESFNNYISVYLS